MPQSTPYLHITVTMTLRDWVCLPAPTETTLLAWLETHGIDVTQPFSWEDSPGSLHRIFRQTRLREAQHDHAQ